MTIFFTSDNHFGHSNIIEYANRPFSSVEEMDEKMIENWNLMVNPDDTVYHLGDFTLGNESTAWFFFKQLNGKVFILGNHSHHDNRWLKRYKTLPYESMFITNWNYKGGSKVTLLPPLYSLEIDMGEQYPFVIVLCHYPMAIWDRKHYGSIHLFGHSHGKYNVPFGDKAMDVGVDCHEFYPVSLDSVLMQIN